ncbi:MAG: thioredoxin family protein, partial [Gemmatimonadaceae bacterium]|nr:thioredoxin family protein [Gemmatimonadaceae bacterium]
SSIDAARRRWRLLVVAENSCTDAANTLPYLAALADRSPFIDIRVLRKADATDLLAAHPLGERQATPLVLVYDPEFTLRGAWIEHPASLRSLISALGDTLDRDSVRARVRAWYREDAGRSALREVLGIMERGGPRPDAPSSKPPACGS